MFHRIHVPLDGSPFAEQALPAALAIARRNGGSIELAVVHEPPSLVYAGAEFPVDNALEAVLRKRHREYLAKVRARLPKGVCKELTTTLLEGMAVDAIYDHALTRSTNLVVMATHGRGAVSRFWLGSVADKLIRLLPIPVLLVRPGEEVPNLSADTAPKRILVPLDGSALAEQILRPTCELANLMKAEVLLARVIEPIVLPEYTYGGVATSAADLEAIAKAKTEAAVYLERVAARLHADACIVHTRVVNNLPAAAAILRLAKEEKADLIAMETHGRGGMARFLLGSVADKVIRGAHVPLLLQHPLSK